MVSPRKRAESIINKALLDAEYPQEYIDKTISKVREYFDIMQVHRPDADTETFVEKVLNKLDFDWSWYTDYDDNDYVKIYPKT